MEKNVHVKRIAWQRIKVLREMAKKRKSVNVIEEKECWMQTEAYINGYPEITAFLRSKKRTARFACFHGYKQAEAFVRAHFCGDLQQPHTTTTTRTVCSGGPYAWNSHHHAVGCEKKKRNPGDLHPTERHRAVATFGGCGGSDNTAFVVIEKVSPVNVAIGHDSDVIDTQQNEWNNKKRQWMFDEDELKLLNKLYHGPNPNKGVKRSLAVRECGSGRPSPTMVVQPRSQSQSQAQSVASNGNGEGNDDNDDDDVPLAKRPLLSVSK